MRSNGTPLSSPRHSVCLSPAARPPGRPACVERLGERVLREPPLLDERVRRVEEVRRAVGRAGAAGGGQWAGLAARGAAVVCFVAGAGRGRAGRVRVAARRGRGAGRRAGARDGFRARPVSRSPPPTPRPAPRVTGAARPGARGRPPGRAPGPAPAPAPTPAPARGPTPSSTDP